MPDRHGTDSRNLFALYARHPDEADRIVFGRIANPDRRGFLKGAGLATINAPIVATKGNSRWREDQPRNERSVFHLPAIRSAYRPAGVTVLDLRAYHDALADLRSGWTGSHASPRPHLRRGHPRQHPSSRHIWIMDMLVGVDERTREAFKSKRETYRVKPPKPAND